MSFQVGDRVRFLGIHGKGDEPGPYTVQGRQLPVGTAGTVRVVNSSSYPYRVEWDGYLGPYSKAGASHAEKELELIMVEIDANKIGQHLRFLADQLLDSGSADVVRAYADEIDPQNVTLTLTPRQRDILFAVVDGGNTFSMTNRASHSIRRVGIITVPEYNELWKLLDGR